MSGTALAAMAAPTVSAVSDTNVTLTWNAPTTAYAINGYVPSWSTDGQNWTNEPQTAALSATINGLQPGTNYSFRIACIGASVSASAQATTAVSGSRIPSQQPFSSASVWNIGIGSGATWSNATDADTEQLQGATWGVNCVEYSQPIYVGQWDDPVVEITNSDTIFPTPPQYVHVPINATPALPKGTPPNQTDAHMAFFDLTNPGIMWSYYGCVLKNGTDVTGGISAMLGSVQDVRSDQISTLNTPGANNYNFAIGTIRDWEMEAGVIKHAMRIALSYDILKSTGSTWLTNPTWPNNVEDYNGPTDYTGNVLWGVTVGIPSTVDVGSLGLTTAGLMVATALQQYGAIIRDSGGSGQVVFFAEPLCNTNHPTMVADINSDLPKMASSVFIMRNQGPNNINGGGTYPQPLPPLAIWL